MRRLLYELNWHTFKFGWSTLLAFKTPEGLIVKRLMRHNKTGEMRTELNFHA